MDVEEPNVRLEKEHGIKLILVPSGDLPSTHSVIEDSKTDLNSLPRQLKIEWSELPENRGECPTLQGFYLGSTEVSRRQLESVYRALYTFDGYTIDQPPFEPIQVNAFDAPAVGFSFGEAAVFCNAISKLYGIPEYYRFTLAIKPEDRTSHFGLGTWRGVIYFIEIPDKDGKGFRLPTACEWEYACRAGASTAFSFGDDSAAMCEYGRCQECKDERGRRVARPIDCASYKPNRWGFHDMHGNVWEWCMGRFDGMRLCNEQYLKGGSVNSSSFESRCSYLRKEATSNREIENIGFGFRIARSD